jgi:hypothetical protein
VVWKNIEVIDTIPLEFTFTGATMVTNISTDKFIDLHFTAQNDNNAENILDYSRVRFLLSKQILKSWREGGSKGEGIIPVNDSTIELTKASAYMKNVFMFEGETGLIAPGFKPKREYPGPAADYFDIDLAQFDSRSQTVPVGGERFKIKKDWTVNSCNSSFDQPGNTSGTHTFTRDTLYVANNIVLNAGDTLNLGGTVLYFAAGKKIIINPSAKLIAFESEFAAACPDTKWGGIRLLGDSTQTEALRMAKCFLSDVDTAVYAQEGSELTIVQNTFYGSATGIALLLKDGKDFNCTANNISNYVTGIKTDGNRTVRNSYIRRNIINDVDTALRFIDDTHNFLNITCNTLSYGSRGIFSDAVSLKNQGNSTNGAGNIFTSASSLSHHMLKHSGSSMTYYYDPAMSVANYMNTTVSAAANNQDCFTYTFDTAGTRKHVPIIVEVGSKLRIWLSPNPASEEVTITYDLGGAESGVLQFVDMYGRVIEEVPIYPSTEFIRRPLSKYNNGVYLVTLTTKYKQVVSRLAVSK